MIPITETNCVISHNGHDYAANGAWLTPTGGAVYIVERDGILRAETWNGEILSHNVKVISQWKVYCRNLGSYLMRSVRFQVDGVTFAGKYGCDWAQLCRVKAVRS